MEDLVYVANNYVITSSDEGWSGILDSKLNNIIDFYYIVKICTKNNSFEYIFLRNRKS